MAADSCCSIETEPKTLNEGQLSHAREMAAGVIQKLEPSEASTIFSEGSLRPTVSIKEMNPTEDPVDKPKAQMTERPCQCSCTSVNPDSSAHMTVREPLSAPF